MVILRSADFTFWRESGSGSFYPLLPPINAAMGDQCLHAGLGCSRKSVAHTQFGNWLRGPAQEQDIHARLNG